MRPVESQAGGEESALGPGAGREERRRPRLAVLCRGAVFVPVDRDPLLNAARAKHHRLGDLADADKVHFDELRDLRRRRRSWLDPSRPLLNKNR